MRGFGVFELRLAVLTADVVRLGQWALNVQGDANPGLHSTAEF